MQRAWLPSEKMASTDSVLMTMLVAVLEESEEIGRRISLVREVVSWGLRWMTRSYMNLSPKQKSGLFPARKRFGNWGLLLQERR